MRQHSIPQNILDVEFKLFSKFTLKEFAYLAIGVGFGGVMIYLTVGKVIPAIIGIPLFIISAGAGIILGLVPINDQDADVFIKNYVTAITNPTQRVWLNKEMQEERTKPELKPSSEGKLVEKSFKEKAMSIIGANIAPPKMIEETEVPQPAPVKVVPEILTISDANREEYGLHIKSIDKLPGNINIWFYTGNMSPVPNVTVYMKDSEGKILYANKTKQDGYFLTNNIWPQGIYYLEFIHPQYKFPKVKFIIEQPNNKLPIKIRDI
jgi:hypothetical protein